MHACIDGWVNGGWVDGQWMVDGQDQYENQEQDSKGGSLMARYPEMTNSGDKV